MTDASSKRVRSQLALQLDPALIEEIKAAAEMRGQTITRWCADLFEAALADVDADAANASIFTLEQRIARLESAVAQLTNPSPI